MPLYRSFINRFGPAEPAVAASIHYYESHPRLSREGYKTDISAAFYLLLTYEGLISAQAEVRIVRNSNNERKNMSTKTTFMRISLVAVAALSMGVISSIAPASAAITNGTVAVVNATASVAVGAAATTAFSATTAGTHLV